MLRRLDLILARNNPAWDEARVLCGEPRPAMNALIREWQPDLVVTCADSGVEALADGAARNLPDVLRVKCHGLYGRFGVAYASLAEGRA